MRAAPPPAQGKYIVAALDRGLGILEELAEHPDLGVTELAKRTGSTKSQAFRMLHTLELRGYVRKDQERRTYSLGYRALYLGERTHRQTSLIRVATPHLRALAEETGENVHLIARDGQRSICIALAQSEQPLRLYAEVGRHGPLHAGGGSTVLLAHAPHEIREAVLAGPLKRFTPTTVTDPERLREVLNTVRRRGWHHANEDVDPGAYALSAPLRDHSGSVVAALSIAGPCSRLDEPTKEQHVERLLNTVHIISTQLGWRDQFAEATH